MKNNSISSLLTAAFCPPGIFGEEEESAPAAKEAQPAEKVRNEMTDNGSVLARDGEHTIHCMTVIGQVEGHYVLGDGQKSTKYEHLIPMLVAVEESRDIDGLLVLLNTVGGDVEAGLAIAEMIASMKKPTVSLVLGGGHSIGVPLAVSARRSFIVPSATMTIHPVRMNGLVLGVPQSFAYFSKMQDRIDRFITGHSGVDEETLRRLTMQTGDIATDMGTIIEGQQAVDYGIIDAVGGLSDALGALKEMCDGT